MKIAEELLLEVLEGVAQTLTQCLLYTTKASKESSFLMEDFTKGVVVLGFDPLHEVK